MPKSNYKDPICWDDLSKKDKEFLTAFRNSTAERKKTVKRILELFYNEKDQEAHTCLPAPWLMTL
tara:strand:- start:37 stop:231 length:195 start_codon:yes stop_codon:yes gene_type:complete